MYPALYEIENGKSNGRVYHFCDEDVDDCRKFFLRDNPLPPQMIAGTSEPVQDSECDYCGKPLADPRDARIAELEAALTNLVKFMDDSGFSTTTIGGKDPFKYGGFEYSVVSDARRALNPSIELNLSDKETE